ncbi:glycosyltransferase [Ferruginibacter sp.]
MHQGILIILLFLLLLYCLFILFYWKSWIAIPEFKAASIYNEPQPFISIIIPARNEERNIKSVLNSVLNQSYPATLFQIIVVDDHSTDNTAAIVSSMNNPCIRLLSLKDFITTGTIAYKKKAIEVAVKQSTGELIVATDADCIVPPNWLQTIAAFYKKTNAAFIVMPVAINNSSRFIEVFQSLDFMTLQGITGASVYKKFHSMCNGANLAYTKKAFTAVNGFEGIDNIASGDDMLLMHKIFKAYPSGVLFLRSKEVIVQTAPVHTIKEFFNQRIRWASKADKYDDKRIFWVLLLVYLLNVALLLWPFSALAVSSTYTLAGLQFSMIEIWLWMLAIKTIAELLFLWPVARFFNKAKLLLWFPLMQPFHIVYTVIAGWLGKFGSYNWKNRNVK